MVIAMVESSSPRDKASLQEVERLELLTFSFGFLECIHMAPDK